MVKVKQQLTPPQQASPYVVNLPQPPVRNAEEYLKAYIGYVYTAVGAIAQEVASIDLHLYRVKYIGGKPTTDEIFEHQILSVLHYVNQIETLYNAIEATQTYLELVGEAFWVVLKDNSGPKEFWLLRPDWVKVIPSPTEVIDHYNYYAGGIITEKVEIPREFVVPFKYFHPMNPYRGKGPVQAAALPFDILNFAQEYNRNFFFNSAIPSMVFSSEQKISESTTKRFLNQWSESFGGRSKANKIAFLGNGMKLDKASFSNKDLDFTESMKAMRDDVLAVFKVPKTVLGLTEDVNRANADATTRAFMERVITPRMRKFVDALNEFFVPMFIGPTDNSLFLDFTDPSPEDVELKLKRYDNGRKNTWLTPNEIRAEENLEPLEGGDDLFAPLGSPTGSINSLSTPNPANQSTQEQDETPNDQNPDKPVASTGSEEEQPKGIRAEIIKLLGGRVPRKQYRAPVYLQQQQEKKRKHMVSIPVKRPALLFKEKLKAVFIPEIKKMIGELMAHDEYSALETKKAGQALTEKDKQLKDLIAQGVAAAEKKKADEKKHQSPWTEEQKTGYWKAFIQRVEEHEAKVKAVCQEVFQRQQEEVLGRLYDQHKEWRKRLGVKATAQTVVPTLEDLDKLWTVLTNLLKEIYIEQGNNTMDFLGAGGTINTTTEFASQYLLEYSSQLIKGIDETTRTQLMQELSAGYDAGEGVDKLTERVKSVFVVADTDRAELIARTETIKASNAASVEAYRQSGVVSGKEWLAERDNRTCPYCEDLDGKVVALDDNYFDKGDSLTVNGQTMQFDYADVGEPPAHGNCRCTTIPVLDIEQQGAPE